MSDESLIHATRCNSGTIMAEVLWHEFRTQKDSADTIDSSGNTFEYLARIKRVNVKTNKGCSFQMDRMTRNNLHRVTRNTAFYFGVFSDHLVLAKIWKVEILVVLAEVERQLDRCKNDIAHVNFLLRWLEDQGGTSICRKLLINPTTPTLRLRREDG